MKNSAILNDLEKKNINTEPLRELFIIGGDDAVRDIVRLAADNILKRFVQLQIACSEKNLFHIEQATHSIRSSAMNLGLNDLERESEVYEHYAENKKNDALYSYEHLNSFIPQIEDILSFL